ncbi:MAG: hypothetical protein NC548_15955 [Lachnospiraceae bacterium]|nr:hypothetical protein [Lachnospiraceae bacterium]
MDEFESMIMNALSNLKQNDIVRSESKSDYERAMEVDWFKNMVENKILPTKQQLIETVAGGIFSDTWRTSNIIRQAYIKKFGFACFSKESFDDLIAYIGNRKCLEVCAGTGWLSSLLLDAGIDIIATDLGTWEKRWNFTDWSKQRIKFIDMDIPIDAVKAINKYSDAEIVIMSWPEYESPLANLVLNKCLETGKELIYIGEDQGGCTADDSFFETIYEKDLEMEPISDHYISFDGDS